LGTDSGRLGQRFDDPEVTPLLEWDVHRGVVIFSLRISTRRTKETLVKCRVDEKDLFVSVPFVDDDRSVDAKLPELGGKSVREVLQFLERDQE
jgi:hypothetical protein